MKAHQVAANSGLKRYTVSEITDATMWDRVEAAPLRPRSANLIGEGGAKQGLTLRCEVKTRTTQHQAHNK